MQIINNFVERTNQTLNQLNLVPEIAPEEYIKNKYNPYNFKTARFYVTKVHQKNKDKVFLYKSTLYNDNGLNKKLFFEIFFQNKAAKEKIDFVLSILHSGSKGEYLYFVREYSQKKPMGDLREITNSKLGDIHSKNLVKCINKSRIFLKKIFNKKDKNFKIYKKNYLLDDAPLYRDYFQNKLKEADIKEKTKIRFDKYLKKMPDFKKIYATYHKIIPALKNKENILIHGDLNPSNIFIDSKNIDIIDWERIHYDYYTGEIDFLFVGAWNRPNWRKKFLKEYIKTIPKKELNFFKDVFQLTIFERSWWEASMWIEILDSVKKNNLGKEKKCTSAIKTNLNTMLKSNHDFNNLLK